MFNATIAQDFSMTQEARVIKIACANRSQKLYHVNWPIQSVGAWIIVSSQLKCSHSKGHRGDLDTYNGMVRFTTNIQEWRMAMDQDMIFAKKKKWLRCISVQFLPKNLQETDLI